MNLMMERLSTLFRYKDLLRELVVRDLKLKYRRSFLGYLWSILNPLLIMLVMVAVFSHMFRAGIENFPVYLLSGQAVFDFIRNSTTMAMYSVLDNGALIKKIYVPKYIFTLSKITSTMVDFVFSLGACYDRDAFSVYTLSAGNADSRYSGLHFCLWHGIFLVGGKCVFQRYSVYLRSISGSMAVYYAVVLSDRSAPTMAPINC